MWADTETPVSSSLGQKLSRLSIHCALRVADYSVGFIALLICSRHHLSLLRELRALWIFLFVVLLWLPRFTALALGYILGLGGESFAASQNPVFSNPCVSCVLTVISLLLVSARMPLRNLKSWSFDFTGSSWMQFVSLVTLVSSLYPWFWESEGKGPFLFLLSSNQLIPLGLYFLSPPLSSRESSSVSIDGALCTGTAPASPELHWANSHFPRC